jgi:hypothetical protein
MSDNIPLKKREVNTSKKKAGAIAFIFCETLWGLALLILPKYFT